MDTGAGFDFVYAGMDAMELATWLGLATIAGHLALRLIPGPAFLGLWGDMVIGLVGAFSVGWSLRVLGVDPSQYVLKVSPAASSEIAVAI
ncbi:MAG: hypothetical protein MI723_09030, partial [Caulobacterales bacterium]|nr:hypothetical protein [Caulobacterales bacterium]